MRTHGHVRRCGRPVRRGEAVHGVTCENGRHQCVVRIAIYPDCARVTVTRRELCYGETVCLWTCVTHIAYTTAQSVIT